MDYWISKFVWFFSGVISQQNRDHFWSQSIGLCCIVLHIIAVDSEGKNSKHEGPILIHAVTKKGKGYKPAEDSGDKYHGVSKFNVLTGEQSKGKSKNPSYTNEF